MFWIRLNVAFGGLKIMSSLINFITGGAETFTPAVLVGLFVFVSIWDGLCNLLSSFSKGVRR